MPAQPTELTGGLIARFEPSERGESSYCVRFQLPGSAETLSTQPLASPAFPAKPDEDRSWISFLSEQGKELHRYLFPPALGPILQLALTAPKDQFVYLWLVMPPDLTPLHELNWEWLHDGRQFLLEKRVLIVRCLAESPSSASEVKPAPKIDYVLSPAKAVPADWDRQVDVDALRSAWKTSAQVREVDQLTEYLREPKPAPGLSHLVWFDPLKKNLPVESLERFARKFPPGRLLYYVQWKRLDSGPQELAEVHLKLAELLVQNKIARSVVLDFERSPADSMAWWTGLYKRLAQGKSLADALWRTRIAWLKSIQDGYPAETRWLFFGREPLDWHFPTPPKAKPEIRPIPASAPPEPEPEPEEVVEEAANETADEVSFDPPPRESLLEPVRYRPPSEWSLGLGRGFVGGGIGVALAALAFWAVLAVFLMNQRAVNTDVDFDQLVHLDPELGLSLRPPIAPGVLSVHPMLTKQELPAKVRLENLWKFLGNWETLTPLLLWFAAGGLFGLVATFLGNFFRRFTGAVWDALLESLIIGLVLAAAAIYFQEGSFPFDGPIRLAAYGGLALLITIWFVQGGVRLRGFVYLLIVVIAGEYRIPSFALTAWSGQQIWLACLFLFLPAGVGFAAQEID